MPRTPHQVMRATLHQAMPATPPQTTPATLHQAMPATLLHIGGNLRPTLR
jgi:hypothetical protein